jgi:hypothetical protein
MCKLYNVHKKQNKQDVYRSTEMQPQKRTRRTLTKKNTTRKR